MRTNYIVIIVTGIHRLLVQLIKRHSAIVWFLLILVAASVNVLYFKGITLRRSIFVTVCTIELIHILKIIAHWTKH